MQQIPQSQFISICQTLHQIITSLNENRFNATFESIINRLSSSFESVVIPPLSAVRKSLDLLVKKKKLVIVEGCYFVRNTQALCIQRQMILNHNSSVGLGSRARDKENPVFKAEKPTMTECGMKEKSKKRNIKISNGVKEDIMGSKRKVEKAFAERRNKKAGVESDKRKTKYKKKRCDRKLEKPSYKSRIRNNFISNGNYLFDKLSYKGKDTIEHLETEGSPLTCEKKQKRFSFLGKLSRLFNKRASCEEDELTSEESESGTENRLYEYQIDDEHTKLVPRRDTTRRNRKEFKKKKEKCCDKKWNVQSERKANPNKISHEIATPAKQTTCKEVKYETAKKRDVLLHKGKYVKNFNTTTCSQSLTSSASSCSSYEWKKNDFREYDRRNRTTEKSARSEPQELLYHDQYHDYSSWSDTSSFIDGHSSSDDSSDTCCELTRTPLNYSPAITHENIKMQRGAKEVLNFCSTQAICGDLELSTPSLINPGVVANVQQMSSSTTIAEHTTNTKTPMVTLNDLERRPSADDKNSSELPAQTKNLFQLIGIL